MFVLDAQSDLPALLGSLSSWSFISCASFEPRWTAFGEFVSETNLVPTDGLVLFPTDPQNRWHEECHDRQEKSLAEFCDKSFPFHDRIDLDLLRVPAWDVCDEAIDTLLERSSNERIHIVVDISTLPRMCLFPIIARLMNESRVDTLVAVYSEPNSYGKGLLRAEPTQPTVVQPFDFAPTLGKPEVAWIPILGFNAAFADAVHTALTESYSLRNRLFPLIGFPAFEPTLFERVYREVAEGRFETDAARIKDRFRFAKAASPFDTRERILELVSSIPEVHWIGTPMGPKPMALGMALAAMEAEITVLISPSRSYHPEYSEGTKRIDAYILRQGGQRAY